ATGMGHAHCHGRRSEGSRRRHVERAGLVSPSNPPPLSRCGWWPVCRTLEGAATNRPTWPTNRPPPAAAGLELKGFNEPALPLLIRTSVLFAAHFAGQLPAKQQPCPQPQPAVLLAYSGKQR